MFQKLLSFKLLTIDVLWNDSNTCVHLRHDHGNFTSTENMFYNHT
jgi:hypothetical protein